MRGSELHWVGVGDSRLYRYRAEDDTLSLCTTDHNYASQPLQRVAASTLDPAEAATNPDRRALTSFLGLEAIPEVDHNLHPVHLAPGDRLPLCSDGVYGVLPDADLRQLLRQDAQAAANALIGAVKTRNLSEQDNATVAVVGIDGGAVAQAAPSLVTGSAGAVATPPPQPHWRLRSVLLALSALLLLALGVAIGFYLRAAAKPDPNPGAQAACRTPAAVTGSLPPGVAGRETAPPADAPDGAGEPA